jgi:hypothetical protein
MTVLHCNINIMQLGKMTREEIEKELVSTGLSSEAVQGIIDVLSIKSLSKLEGFLLTFCCWLVIMHAPYHITLLQYYTDVMLLNWKMYSLEEYQGILLHRALVLYLLLSLAFLSI